MSNITDLIHSLNSSKHPPVSHKAGTLRHLIANCSDLLPLWATILVEEGHPIKFAIKEETGEVLEGTGDLDDKGFFTVTTDDGKATIFPINNLTDIREFVDDDGNSSHMAFIFTTKRTNDK